MKLKELGQRLSRVRDILGLGLILALIVGMFVLFPLSLPAIVATNAKTIGWFKFIVAGVIYLIIWLSALFGVIDSAAYIYDFQRPFIAARPSSRFFTLGDSGVKSRLSFVITALISYASTLYGFAVAYALISNLDPKAFNVQRPLDFITSVYFTVSTAATVGFGDIAPVSALARVVTTAEVIVSFLYLILIFSTIGGLARVRIADHEKRK